MNGARMGALTIVSLAALLTIIPRTQLSGLQAAGGNSHLGLLITDIHLDPVTVNPSNPNFSESQAIQLLESTQNIDDWPAQLAKFQKNIARPKQHPAVDANYPLVDAALKNAADKTVVEGSFDYVIFTGDMLRHDFPRSGAQERKLAQKAAAFVVRQLNSRFNVPVFVALGNNDADNCDYGITPADNNKPNEFLDAVADEMTILKGNTQANDDFRKGGYCVLPHPTVANQDIIVLNSVFWSNSYLSYCDGPYTAAPGLAEMSWLDEKLSDAAKNHRGVTLVMHVPPGVDPHNSQPGSEDSLFWCDKARPNNPRHPCTGAPGFNTSFAALMAKYSKIIPVAFAGHSHMDDFRSFEEAAGVPEVPWRIGLAVSPVFGNNPGFSTFSYDPKTAAISDMSTFTAAPGSATFTHEYGFDDAYDVKGFSAANLDAVNAVLRTCTTNCADIVTFEEHYKPGNYKPGSPWSSSDLKNVACSQRYIAAGDVSTCISK